MRTVPAVFAATAVMAAGSASAATPCGKACLEKLGAQYRAAYLAHDPKLAPFSSKVRFTENNVEMRLPDGSWDTVTREVGPALTFSDPTTGSVGIYTSIMQMDTPGFLAIRLKVAGGRITEVEHLIGDKRWGGPFGPVESFQHDPDYAAAVGPAERMSRAELIRIANGYWSSLENNVGQVRDTAFAATAKRYENGREFADLEKGFRDGIYRFNERVRDRDYFLVDETRGIVMSRAYIDHKGLLDTFALTDGTQRKSIFREPQSWGVLEMFKIKRGEITGIEAAVVQTPYYMRSPWTRRLDMRTGGLTPPPPRPPASAPAPTNPPLED